MPLAIPRVKHITSKLPLPTTSLILETCTAMSCPRVAASTLERAAARVLRIQSRTESQPTRKLTQNPKPATDSAVVLNRAKTLLARRAAASQSVTKACAAPRVLDKYAARRERIFALSLKLKESRQQGK